MDLLDDAFHCQDVLIGLLLYCNSALEEWMPIDRRVQDLFGLTWDIFIAQLLGAFDFSWFFFLLICHTVLGVDRDLFSLMMETFLRLRLPFDLFLILKSQFIHPLGYLVGEQTFSLSVMKLNFLLAVPRPNQFNGVLVSQLVLDHAAFNPPKDLLVVMHDFWHLYYFPCDVKEDFALLIL